MAALLGSRETVTKPQIVSFFIFDPTLKPTGDKSELEESDYADAKIIYYCPSYKTMQEKRSQASLVEGLIGFMRPFTSQQEEVLDTVRTNRLVISVYNCESDIWLAMVVQNGTKGAKIIEDDSLDCVYQATIKNFYRVFRLLHGEIGTFVKQYSMERLVDLLEDFVPAFVETIDAEHVGVFADLDGFHYGPVERNTYISIQSFVLKVQEQFPEVRSCSLLYDAHLIYAGMAQEDIKALYTYLVSFNGIVSNNKLNEPPFGRIPTAASQPGGGSSSFGRAHLLSGKTDFLFGPSNSTSSMFIPTVYLNDYEGKLVVFVYYGIMLICILNAESQITAERLEALREECGKPNEHGLSLRDLQPIIAEQFNSVMEQDDEYRFLYYNHANDALRVSNKSTSRWSAFGGGETKRSGRPCIGDKVSHFEDPEEKPKAEEFVPPKKIKEENRRKKLSKHYDSLAELKESYNPKENESATHDPFRTLFIARINFDTTEKKLKKEFETYGPIRRMKMVFDRKGKPRGYAFIEFDSERDLRNAYKHGDGKKIDGRRVLVDVERGRTVAGWYPRRLGGGRGPGRSSKDDLRRMEEEEREKRRKRDEEDRRRRDERRERDRGRDDRDRGRDREGGRDDRRERSRDRGRDRDRDRDRGRDREREREERGEDPMKEGTSKENDDRNEAESTRETTTGADADMKDDRRRDDEKDDRRRRSTSRKKRSRSRDRRRARDEEAAGGEERESKRSRRDDDDHW